MESADTSNIKSALPVITDPEVLREAMVQNFNHRIETDGEAMVPCVPAMGDYYIKRITALLDTFGHPIPEQQKHQLHGIIRRKLEEGFELSAHAHLRLKYGPSEPPKQGLSFQFSVSVLSEAEEYQQWIDSRAQPWFGNEPDAKAIALATQLGDPATTRILDVGAGTGRNTFALAQKNYCVDAIELAPAFLDHLQGVLDRVPLPVTVTPGEIFDPLLRMPLAHYRLAIATDVLSAHCRDVDRLRLFLVKMCDVLCPGGLLLMSLFFVADESHSDRVTRQMSQVNWSCLFARSDLATAMEGLPLELISDESLVEYERTHRSPEAWPPNSQFTDWATGRELFASNADQPIMELRWITCKRL